jgi:hypothetical protein
LTCHHQIRLCRAFVFASFLEISTVSHHNIVLWESLTGRLVWKRRFISLRLSINKGILALLTWSSEYQLCCDRLHTGLNEFYFFQKTRTSLRQFPEAYGQQELTHNIAWHILCMRILIRQRKGRAAEGCADVKVFSMKQKRKKRVLQSGSSFMFRCICMKLRTVSTTLGARGLLVSDAVLQRTETRHKIQT